MRRALVFFFSSLSILVWSADAPAATKRVRVHGTVEAAHAPPTFALRREDGCARDVRLRAVTTGAAFDLDLDAGELALALACPVDVRAGDAALDPIALAPRASAEGSGDLALDPAIAVAASTLDPAAEHVVRVTITSRVALDAASLVVGGARLGALLTAPDGDLPASAVFDVPARAWAAAVVGGAAIDVTARTADGRTHALTLRPAVDLEPLSDDEDEGC